MLLTYSIDRFVTAIQAGSKIHTIREDRHHRWRAGLSIQHWRGNPRNVRNNPYQFAEGECKSVQTIVIRRRAHLPAGMRVMVDWRILQPEEIKELAGNDGLTVDELREWFVGGPATVFYGRIIHFTDKKY